MKLFVLIGKMDYDNLEPKIFADSYSAEREMISEAAVFFEKRNIIIKSDDGVLLSTENITKIQEEGFYVDDADEQGFYEIKLEDNSFRFNSYDTDVPVFEAEIKEVELPRVVAESIFRSVHHDYLLEDAEMQLQNYLMLSDNVDLYDYLINLSYESIKTEEDVDKLLQRIVEIYEKKADCNIDENSTWHDACFIAVNEFSKNKESIYISANQCFKAICDKTNKLFSDVCANFNINGWSYIFSIMEEIDRNEENEDIFLYVDPIASFENDNEKMRDFKELTKEEFLASYSNLTEYEYDATVAELARKEL